VRSTDAALSVPPEAPRPRPKPKPDKQKSKKPCPPKETSKNSKDAKGGRHDKDKKMFGANGAQINSITLHDATVGRYHYRIDVENPAPGKRPGSLHVQLGGRGSTHYQYRPRTKKFVAANGDRLPRAVQNHIDTDPKARAMVKRGLRMLGEG
jgi:hypothetical protein